MKVLIVNTYDRGGAANACLRLHDGLLQEGIDSKALLKHKQKQIPQTFQFHKPYKPKNKFQILKQKTLSLLRVLGVLKKPSDSKEEVFFKARQPGLELYSFPNSNFDITTSPLYHEADIINLHWVAGFLDYESFFRKNTKPVVWTLHDMNPFTGGEHYTETFLGMDALGYPIPRLLSAKEKQTFKQNLLIKKQVIDAINDLTIVSPSKWLAEEAEKSPVFKFKKICCIPYGINSNIFKTRDKNYSRAVLNIPKNKKVILFVADSISNHRKGYVFLKKAFEMLQSNNVVLCAIGSKKSTLDTTSNHIELGTIQDARLMSIAYSAADVFVIPSLMDNLPNTVLESLMCGTPVIGFPVGGIVDMIQPGENGLLTNEISSQALVDTIEHFLRNINAFDRNKISEEAKKKYALSIQADSYINLFNSILEKKTD